MEDSGCPNQALFENELNVALKSDRSARAPWAPLVYVKQNMTEVVKIQEGTQINDKFLR